jgi:hypothetical protein
VLRSLAFVSGFSRSGSAATILGLLLGLAAPARAQSADDATDETEAPEIEVPAVPRRAAPRAEPEPPLPPLMPRTVHRPRIGLIVAGAVTYAASYGAALFLGLATVGAGAAEPCDDCGSRAAVTVIPVAGPLLAWKTAPERDRGSAFWWAAWSGVQVAGLAMLVAGLVGHDVEWRPHNGRPAVSLVPAFTGKLAALSLNVGW